MTMVENSLKNGEKKKTVDSWVKYVFDILQKKSVGTP